MDKLGFSKIKFLLPVTITGVLVMQSSPLMDGTLVLGPLASPQSGLSLSPSSCCSRHRVHLHS